MHRVVFLFFLSSGFTSLVFEVIWARMLQQVFGTTSFAISTLLTAFMAGLALGSFLGGKIAHRVRDPLRAYGIIEAAIGAYALVVPLFLALLPGLYGLLFDRFLDQFYLFSLLRFVAVFAILLVPTTLMGATLPLVSQWIAARQHHFQIDVGLLYGANTLGACLGCLLAGFLLLPNLGLSATNLTFAMANFALAAVVLIVAPRLPAPAPTEDADLDESDLDDNLTRVLGSSPRPAPHPRWALQAALFLFGLTGLVAMGYQVLWTRAYVITLGSSTYSFTLVLTAVLIGIALGAAAISPFLGRIHRPLKALAMAQVGVAAGASLSFFVLDRVPLWLLERIRGDLTGVAELYFFQFGLVALAVLLPSLLQGMSFPLMIRAVASRRARSGTDVGHTYAFNTAGAILGAFLSGFLLLPWLGLQGAIAALIGLNLLIALVFTAIELRLHFRPITAIALGASLIATSALLVMAPPIDPLRLTSGIFRIHMARQAITPGSLQDPSAELLFYADGITATTTVERRGGAVVLRANGKAEASDGADMATQILVGLLPLLVHAELHDGELGDESVAMIGYGSGVTAGASLQWPLRELDVVEIEATMKEASRFFDHVNHRPLEDPRHRFIESDGRNYLEYVDKTYDVIISEPSNPWIAGVSSLFTVEYFQRAQARLSPGGVYGQWVQLYELRPENVRRIFATFLDTFPYVHAFSSKARSTDLILVGSDQPLRFSPDSFHGAFEIPEVRRELQRAGVQTPEELPGLLFMTDRELRDFAASADLNTDDNGLLEFSAPFDLVHAADGEEFFARLYYSSDFGDLRPYLQHWPQGWDDSTRAALIRGAWVGGNQDIARDLLTSLPAGPDDTATFQVARTLEATDLPLNQFSVYDPALADVVTKIRDRRWRQALEDLESLHHLDRDPAYLRLLAEAQRRRRRYADAFETFDRLALLTAEAPGSGPAEAASPPQSHRDGSRQLPENLPSAE